jgi:hypothetical protein|uniref:Uncharacterized protein n=1 Tax=viral metagenome TaxID=1070528 RepID=A0A6C0EE52_9ZZZZ
MSKKNYNNNYVRPQQTYQELLSNQDIKDKLKEYKKIDDINKISIGTHIRYFNIDKKTNTKLFRLGGTLNKIDPNNRFITLNNGNLSWSVQLNSSILYRKMTEDEIKTEMKEELKKEIMTEEVVSQIGGSNSTINDLKNEIKILNKKLENYMNLEKEYKIILKKNESLSNKLLKIESEIKKKKY